MALLVGGRNESVDCILSSRLLLLVRGGERYNVRKRFAIDGRCRKSGVLFRAFYVSFKRLLASRINLKTGRDFV